MVKSHFLCKITIENQLSMMYFIEFNYKQLVKTFEYTSCWSIQKFEVKDETFFLMFCNIQFYNSQLYSMRDDHKEDFNTCLAP